MYNKVTEAMERLRKYDLFYGFSTTVTRLNVDTVTGDEFFREMAEYGCRMGIYIEYIPSCGGNEHVLNLEEKERLRAKILQFRQSKKFLLFHLPKDEYVFGGGCLSAGKGFLHITSGGYVEPCPFVHYSCANIKDKSFRDILGSPFLSDLREKAALFSAAGGCGLFENISEVSSIAGKHNAINTLQGE